MKKIKGNTCWFVLLILFIVMGYIIILNIIEMVNASKREGLESDWIDKGFPDLDIGIAKLDFSGLRNGLRGAFNPMTKFFNEELPNKVKEKVSDPFMQIINDLKAKIEDIKNRFDKMGKGIDGIFKGIGQEFTGLGEGLHDGFDDIGTLFKFTGQYIGSYLECGMLILSNFGSCWIYYVIHMIGQILYLIPATALYMFYLININIYPFEKLFWTTIYDMDKKIGSIIGIQFTEWPKSIQNSCYKCAVVRGKVLDKKGAQINDDFNGKMKEKFNRGTKTIKESADIVKNAFS
jgi:hypothetical protein